MSLPSIIILFFERLPIRRLVMVETTPGDYLRWFLNLLFATVKICYFMVMQSKIFLTYFLDGVSPPIRIVLADEE